MKRSRCFSPRRPQDEGFLAELRALEPELSIVVSYGHILRPSLIALPTLGTINVHASLLPALRGAAPIQGAVRAGLAETGVTVMRMVQALDAGPIMLQSRTPISRDETAGELEAAPVGARRAGARRGAHAAVARQAHGNTAGRCEGHVRAQDSCARWRASTGASRAEIVARTIRAYDPKPGRVHDASRRRDQAVRRRSGHGSGSRDERAGHRRDDRRARDARRVRHRHGAGRMRATRRAHAHRSGGVDARSRHRCGRAARRLVMPA